MLATLDALSPEHVSRLQQVPRWFSLWEQRLSRFRQDSELSRLNRSAGRPTRVSHVLWQVIQAALRSALDSGGLVDPTLLPALEAAGYDRNFADMAPISTSKAVLAPKDDNNWQSIICNKSRSTVCLPAGVHLDLGGIAKGWAGDQSAKRLGRYGPTLVDAGGDIAISSPPRGEIGWPIGIADPAAPDRQVAMLCVPRGGVATSGRDYRRWQRNGKWVHHLLDPRTGLSAETDVLSATAIAPNCEKAETIAKAALILGSQKGLVWLEQHNLAALVICDDGRLIRSRRFDDYLWR
ncbi:MAG: FAD:protein FMN transferase [Dehalococcoidia bacterium]|nr:FAD:protein FMN transferase [Dehalococcoidia bacterium]